MMIGFIYSIGHLLMFVVLNWVYNRDKKTVEEMETTLGRNNADKIGSSGDED